jgi:Cu/Zn superoxide dismutase
VDANGKAEASILAPRSINVGGLVGKALVVHNKDGARIACGVIHVKDPSP